jgi:hypothetical protein
MGDTMRKMIAAAAMLLIFPLASVGMVHEYRRAAVTISAPYTVERRALRPCLFLETGYFRIV